MSQGLQGLETRGRASVLPLQDVPDDAAAEERHIGAAAEAAGQGARRVLVQPVPCIVPKRLSYSLPADARGGGPGRAGAVRAQQRGQAYAKT